MNNIRDKIKAAITTDVDGDVPMEAAGEESKPDATDSGDSPPRTAANVRRSDPLADALKPLIDQIPAVLSDETLRFISPACYVSFWALQLGDFFYPSETYATETSKLITQARK